MPAMREPSNPSTRRPFPPARRFVVKAMRAGRRAAPMHGLVQVDITEALAALRGHGRQGSLTAYVVVSVGRAVAAHPQVHAYRDFRGRLVRHDGVDIATIVEIATPDGLFPLAHVVRNAQDRTVLDVGDELHAVKSRPSESATGRWLTRLTAIAARVPFLLSVFYWVAARSVTARRRFGTVTITSVGMFLGGSGHGIGVPTIMPLTVLIGGVNDRPWVGEGEIVIRQILDLTVTIDHTTVDGAPAARFGAMLRELLVSGEVLSDRGRSTDG